MQASSTTFANALAKSRDMFEQRFFRVAEELGLENVLSPREFSLLYAAAFYAAACHISLNGLGEYGGEISPEMERNRVALEWAFMGARDELFECAGWRALGPSHKRLARVVFLSVFVQSDKLAF